MFFGSSVFKKVKHLSGGERIRLKLGRLLYEDINLLILDEPTNHLDINSIETFEAALEEFKGTICFISHDRYFINKIGERVINIEDNAFKSYPGNYDYYKSIKDELRCKVLEEPVVKSGKIKKPRDIDESVKKEAEKAKVETRVENLDNEIKEIDLAMTDEKVHYDELNKLYSRREELSKEQDRVMELWLKINN